MMRLLLLGLFMTAPVFPGQIITEFVEVDCWGEDYCTSEKALNIDQTRYRIRLVQADVSATYDVGKRLRNFSDSDQQFQIGSDMRVWFSFGDYQGDFPDLSDSSLALIGNASAHDSLGRRRAPRAEAFSIRRLEGSRWRLRRTRQLWGLKAALVRPGLQLSRLRR